MYELESVGVVGICAKGDQIVDLVSLYYIDKAKIKTQHLADMSLHGIQKLLFGRRSLHVRKAVF